ncbi:MAG: AraC family transcriptional regulator [Oscillospiraceae bacterium]|nr:AraC family transcriptional regulator [Oscillospiraceae bacterium]
MDWVQSLSKALDYIEKHLTDDIGIDEISGRSYASSSHFQLVFHLVTGMTIGEYIRNRRLSLAAQDLMQPNSKIIDVAMRYRYDTQESFSKAFSRFHGTPPSKVQWGNYKSFDPLAISINIQGGFDMSFNKINEFHMVDWSKIGGKKSEQLTDAEKYKKLIDWASQARGRNPLVFDALTEWVLDDAEWGEGRLAENEQILIQGVLARFKGQNAQLRAYLNELKPSGVVNDAVFEALDIFDDELSGNLLTGSRPNTQLSETVAKVFADFSIMKDRGVRELIAGNKTGPYGTDSVVTFGYIQYLKGSDAQVQWCLFMPDLVKRQQDGFMVDSFEYKTMPAMRFIGVEVEDESGDIETAKKNNMDARNKLFATLDNLDGYKSGFDYDVLFQHHYGKGVDVERWHGFWGRFMKAGAPVPEGAVYWDFVPDDFDTPYLTFCSQFALATFSGDIEAMHNDEGTDGGRMYDITRNIILGQGVNIPYPEIYWTADVFVDGRDKPSTAFMFSVVL